MSDSLSNELVPSDSSRPKQPKRRTGYASRSAKLRNALMAAVTPADIYEITKLQIFLALRGDPMAVREVLDRVVGKPASMEAIMEQEAREGGNFSGPMMTELQPADMEAIAMDATIPAGPQSQMQFQQCPHSRQGDDFIEACNDVV